MFKYKGCFLFFAMLPLFMALTCNKDTPKDNEIEDAILTFKEGLKEVVDAVVDGYVPESMVVSDLKVTELTHERISISWKKPGVEFEGVSDISYEISYRKKGQDVWGRSFTQSQNTFTMKHLVPLTTYEMRIRVKYKYKGNDCYADKYAELTAMTLSAISAPTGLKVTRKSGNDFRLIWNTPRDYRNYYVMIYSRSPEDQKRRQNQGNLDYSYESSVTFAGGLQPFHVFTGLTPGSTYDVDIIAGDGYGNVGSPASITVTTNPSASYNVTYRQSFLDDRIVDMAVSTNGSRSFLMGTTDDFDVDALWGKTIDNKGGWIQRLNEGGVKIEQKTYPGTVISDLELNYLSYKVKNKVVPAINGGFILAGIDESSTVGAGIDESSIAAARIAGIDLSSIVGNTGGNTWVVKTDANGVKQWRTRVRMLLAGITPTADGGCIVTGSRYDGGSEGVIGGVRLDKQGKVMWSKQIQVWSSASVVRVRNVSMIPGLDDGFTILKSFTLKGEDYISGWGYDGEGRKTWEKSVVATGLCRVATPTPDGGFILVGKHTGAATVVGIKRRDNDPLPSLSGGFTTAPANIFVSKYTPRGHEEWRREYGENAPHRITDVLYATDGSFILAGSKGSSSNTVSWIRKYSSHPSGTLEWSKNFHNMLIGAINKTGDGGWIVGATFLSSKGDDDIKVFNVYK